MCDRACYHSIRLKKSKPYPGCVHGIAHNTMKYAHTCIVLYYIKKLKKMKENLQGRGGAANEVGVVNVVVLKHAQLYDLVVEFTKQAV